MRVFVTGASGFIGQAVVPELIRAGHEVLGLARSDAAASAIEAAGASVHRGSIEDLESLARGAAAADGVIHLAYHHDFSDIPGAATKDRRVIQAIGEALSATGKPFVGTLGTLLIAPGRVVTEEDEPSNPDAHPRFASEKLLLSFAGRGVRASVVRLSPTVHGAGDHAFVPALIDLARRKGVSAYVGDGSDRWSAVHRMDAARLFRLALEKGAAGTRYHGVADEGVRLREVAAVIGRQLNLPVVSRSKQEASDHFGWLAFFLSADSPASSALTRERLGWEPTHASLIADLENGTYFPG